MNISFRYNATDMTTEYMTPNFDAEVEVFAFVAVVINFMDWRAW